MIINIITNYSHVEILHIRYLSSKGNNFMKEMFQNCNYTPLIGSSPEDLS